MKFISLISNIILVNKKQTLLLVFFCTGIVLIPLGLELKQIRVLLTQNEIENILKDPKKTSWCKNTFVTECPLGPFPSKAPYDTIGQSMYFTGIASFILGIITLSKSYISINRRFLSHWIFICGTIISVIILVIMPIEIPVENSESFCIDPWCTPGPYHTQDPAVMDLILLGGIAIALSGAVLHIIKPRQLEL